MNPIINKENLGRIAIFLPSLHGGGAEKVMLILARGFCKRGYGVDVVLAKAQGAYLSQLPPQVRVVDLKATRVLYSLAGLIRYLRSERPIVMLSALDHSNVISIIGKILSRVAVRSVISIHSNFTNNIANSNSLITYLSTYWVRPFYPFADAVIAVSNGVADDLSHAIDLKREKINVIYNPVVTPELFQLASYKLNHPWFKAGEPPVILGVGRLTAAKNFSSLIKAFAKVRERLPVRLMILGDGEERIALEELACTLGIEIDVMFVGYVDNPFCYMRAAALFALTSRWEGFGNVLAEAMACGTPVISTNCPSGPAEILENGRWGCLVQVDDINAIANGMLEQLNTSVPKGMVDSVIERFGEDNIVEKYLEILLP